jgi:hypothetical protein
MQAAREADIFDEVTEDLTYLGYFKNGDSTKCLIKKIEKVGTATSITYPGGLCNPDQDWADRAILSYTYKR